MDGLAGIASGVDTSALVEKLMELERGRRDRMDLRRAAINERSSDLRQVQSKLLALSSAAAGLRDVGTWADKQTVESSDTTRVVAERVAGAGPGATTITVLTMARAEQRTYTFTPRTTASTITVAGTDFSLAANATLDDAVAAINGATGSPVYAVNVNNQLVLSARTTGAASAFTASGSTIAEDAGKAKTGLDARYRVDGGAVRTSASNVVTDAIAGVRLTFKAVTSTAATITVGAPGADRDGIAEKVKAFVSAYNDLLTTTRAHLDEKKVPGATNVYDAAAGALHGDTGLAAMLAGLRSAVSDVVAGNPAARNELREIGVSTGAVSASGSSADAKLGKLVLDESALKSALDADPQGVRTLLGAAGTDGFAQRIETLIGSYTGANGVIGLRLKEGDTALARLQDQMAREDTRLAGKEQRLKAQFAAMEAALSAAQTQQAWLAGQLALLAP